MSKRLVLLRALHAELDACRACADMVGPVVHGPALLSRVLLVGQAPGTHEGRFGRPFAWTAGRTMFRWFAEALGVDEETFRARVYMAAVARCFPGKASGGGDRKPSTDEIARCRRYLEGEVAIVQPDLVLAVGTLAIGEILGETARRKRLDQIVGHVERTSWLGRDVDVVALPHPSGASPWHKMEPGKTLLARALGHVRDHPAFVATFDPA